MPNESKAVIATGSGLGMQYGAQVVLDGAEFIVHENERIGVLGRNGAGKSTLLKLVAQAEVPHVGTLTRQRGITVGFLPQDLALDNPRTVRENILDGAKTVREWITRYETLPHDAPEALELEHRIDIHQGWDLERRVAELATRLRIPSVARVAETLSGGEKRRVGLARTLVGQPDLLILDEPTNHLDTIAVDWLEDLLAAYRGTCMMVTHDRYFLDRVATRILEVVSGTVYSHPGNYGVYLRGKAAREDAADQQEAARQNFLRREVEWIRRGPKARTTKSRSRVTRYETAAAQRAPEREQDVDLIIPPAAKLGARVVELNGVGVQLGDRWLFSGLDLAIRPGERIGIVGRNGAGKTTLLKVVMGELEPTAGTVVIGARTRFNYVDQQRLLLNDQNTVLEEVGEGKDSVQFGDRQIGVWGYLDRFLFTGERINTMIKWLSGGERSRVLLAKILKNGGNVLILDEPTNDLDLATLRVIEEALIAFPGCVLLVSHDRCFLDRVCTAIIGFEDGPRVVYQEGDYDYYQQKLAARQRGRAKTAAATAKADRATRSRPKPRRLSWRETRELEGMEQTIIEAEEHVTKLEEIFAAPDFFARHGSRTAELTAELDNARAIVTRLYQRWEELETIRTDQQ